MKLEQQVCVAHDGTELVVHKATGRPGAEPLVFLHANGWVFLVMFTPAFPHVHTVSARVS